MVPVRIGTLGAARITPRALVAPARKVGGVQLVAVAARDRGRAQAFASKHGIPRVLGSYQELIDDDGIDAVYVPLPNGAHAEWTLKALEAGKHVLCEKPFASNAAEAEKVAAAAAGTDRVVMEAFHWRYHPLAQEVIDIVRSGRIGEPTRLEAALCFPLYNKGDIRWQFDLAGGALMDAGCYPVNIVRHLAGREPQVVSARAKLRSPEVDRAMRAELDFGQGLTGAITTSMWSSEVLKLSASVEGTAGRVKVFNPQAPQLFNLVTVRDSTGTQRRRVPGYATYQYQLEAFAAAVVDGAPILTPPSDAVANMAVIDAIYTAAGLPVRPARVT
jgi:predicted dehydrogenase